jgi:hypothetical protein
LVIQITFRSSAKAMKHGTQNASTSVSAIPWVRNVVVTKTRTRTNLGSRIKSSSSTSRSWFARKALARRPPRPLQDNRKRLFGKCSPQRRTRDEHELPSENLVTVFTGSGRICSRIRNEGWIRLSVLVLVPAELPIVPCSATDSRQH